MRKVLIGVLVLGILGAVGFRRFAPPRSGPAGVDRPPPPRAQPGNRIVLARPAPPAPVLPPAPAPAADEAPPQADGVAPAGAGGPPPIAVRDLGPALRATFEQGLRVDLLGCLLDADLADGFAGKVSLDLHLDETGLQDAAVVDLADVPPDLVDCIADRVWSAEWPRLGSGEVDVTYPVYLTTD